MMATTAATATSPALRDYVGTIRRRFIYIATIFPPVLLLGVFIAYYIRPLYQSTATILLQPSSVTKDVIESTVATNADEQIEIAQSRVMTLDTLIELVRSYDPYPEDTRSSITQKAQRILGATSVEKVDPVTFKPTSDDSNAFSLHYTNPSRERAAAVASRLAQLFLTYHQRQRAQSARDTATFLQQQAQTVTRQISEVDAELATFKTKVGDALPELRDQNQAEIDQAEHNLDTLQQDILASEGKESELSVQLAQTSPNLITQSGDLTDIATVRAQLAEAEQRYTPQHPEVIRLKRALQQLMTQNHGASAAGAQQAKGISAGIVTGATNPQYVMTATELESTRRQVASLQKQAAHEQAKLEQYGQLLRRTPTAERAESDIMRRRQSLQAEYQEIEDKLQSAREAQSFEAEQRGDRFVMLQAPAVPARPSSPNRTGIIALSLLLGLGLSAMAVAMAESVDPHIRNLSDLPRANEIPLLAMIPFITNAHDQHRRRIIATALTMAYAFATLLVGIVVTAARHHQ